MRALSTRTYMYRKITRRINNGQNALSPIWILQTFLCVETLLTVHRTLWWCRVLHVGDCVICETVDSKHVFVQAFIGYCDSKHLFMNFHNATCRRWSMVWDWPESLNIIMVAYCMRHKRRWDKYGLLTVATPEFKGKNIILWKAKYWKMVVKSDEGMSVSQLFGARALAAPRKAYEQK